MEPNKCLIDYLTDQHPAFQYNCPCKCINCRKTREASPNELDAKFPAWEEGYYTQVRHWRGTE
jgi:hypothetical protein